MIGFVLWYMTRELLFFCKTRREYLRRPEESSRLAQRTILLSAIPKDLLTVAKLTELFGSGVEKVSINRDYKELQKLLDESNKNAILLENAETKLIKAVNKIAIKTGRKQVPGNYGKNVSTLYIDDDNRPHHKLGLPVIRSLFGKRV